MIRLRSYRTMATCQTCSHLEKLPYRLAAPTHHENWRCKKNGWTMAYPFTTGKIECANFTPK